MLPRLHVRGKASYAVARALTAELNGPVYATARWVDAEEKPVGLRRLIGGEGAECGAPKGRGASRETRNVQSSASDLADRRERFSQPQSFTGNIFSVISPLSSEWSWPTTTQRI